MTIINIEFEKYVPKIGVLYQIYSILKEHHFFAKYLESKLDSIFLKFDANHLQSQDQEKSVKFLDS